MKNEFYKKINIYLPQEVYLDFSNQAEENGVTKSKLIRQWLQNDFCKITLSKNLTHQNYTSYSFQLDKRDYALLKKYTDLFQISINTFFTFLIRQNSKSKQELTVSQSNLSQKQEYIQNIYKKAFQSNTLRSYVNLGLAHRTFPNNGEIYNDIQQYYSSTIVREIIDNSFISKNIASKFKRKTNFEFAIDSQILNLNSLDILIFDDTVAIIDLKDINKSKIIKNTNYYKNSVKIFDTFWKTLEK
jgi:hypothetical protein